jgi:hypothetical protein
MAFLYGSYYQTGTAWHERVFAPSGIDIDADGNVIDRLSIGRGLAMTPNLHVGKHAGSKAFVQTSTGAIVEIRNTRPDTMIKQSRKSPPLIQDFSCYADNKKSKINFFSKGVRSHERNSKKQMVC